LDAGSILVNGPEDYALAWHGIDWATAEESVRRLRQRMCTVIQDEDDGVIRGEHVRA
jgi:hypothetical protein